MTVSATRLDQVITARKHLVAVEPKPHYHLGACAVAGSLGALKNRPAPVPVLVGALVDAGS